MPQLCPTGWQVPLELKLHCLIQSASKTKASCTTCESCLVCLIKNIHLPADLVSVKTSSSRKWGFQFTQNTESTGTVTAQTSTFLTVLLFLLWEWDTDLSLLGPFDTHVTLGLILMKVVWRLQIFTWVHNKRGRRSWQSTSLGPGKAQFCSLQHRRFPVWQQAQPRPAVGSSNSPHIHSVLYSKTEVKRNRTLHTQGSIQMPQ